MREEVVAVPRAVLVAGALLVALCLALAFFDAAGMARSWLIGFLFWLGVSLGSMAILAAATLTGAAWVMPLRPALLAALKPLPLLALAFVPVAIGWLTLHPWAAGLRSSGLAHLEIWSSTAAVAIRGAIYFAVWIGVAHLIARSRRSAGVAAGALIAWLFTMTMASWDWTMSLGEHWSSTMFGLRTLASQVISGLAVAILASRAAWNRRPSSHLRGDVGNLLLASVLLLGYLTYSELVIIWSANLPWEISWYLPRLEGAWKPLGIVLVAGVLLIPLVVLIVSPLKRSAAMLMTVSALLVAMRLLELVWLVRPAFQPAAIQFFWTDLLAAVAIGILWIGWFLAARKGIRDEELDASPAAGAQSHIPA